MLFPKGRKVMKLGYGLVGGCGSTSRHFYNERFSYYYVLRSFLV